MEIRYRFNSFIKIKEFVFFIGAVEVVAVQPKTQKHHFATKFLLKKRGDRNAATAANRNGFFTKSCFNCFCSSFVLDAVYGCHIRIAAMVRCNLHLYIMWSNFIQMIY